MPDNLTDIAKGLADVMKRRFTPPEFIPGCKVVSVDDVDQYAANNGWIEAICGQHNQQRCRWRGQYASIAVDDYVDVMYFPDRRLFEVHRQGGSGALSATVGAANITSGTAADGYVLTADGAGAADWEALGALAALDEVTSAYVSSGTATDGYVLTADGAGSAAWEAATGGGGDVTGPGSSTDNAIARWDGTAGYTLQDSEATVDDNGDVHVGGDVLGLLARVSYSLGGGGTYVPSNLENFDLSLASGSWSAASWAGSPFVTPATGEAGYSALTIRFSGGTGQRAYLYQTTNMTANKYANFSISTNTVGSYVGLRWDDGTDSNFVELRLEYSGTNTYTIFINYVTGGGAAVKTANYSLSLPTPFIIRSLFFGTKWSSWGTYAQFAHSASGQFVLVGGAPSGLTWTPARWGIVAGGFAASWQGAFVDWATAS